MNAKYCQTNLRFYCGLEHRLFIYEQTEYRHAQHHSLKRFSYRVFLVVVFSWFTSEVGNLRPAGQNPVREEKFCPPRCHKIS